MEKKIGSELLSLLEASHASERMTFTFGRTTAFFRGLVSIDRQLELSWHTLDHVIKAQKVVPRSDAYSEAC